MKINNISKTSFKSYVPIKIYAKDQHDSRFHRVYNNPDNNNYKRCQRQIISNLNGNIENPNEDFINLYKNFDEEYALLPVVRSFYSGGSEVYLISGHDVDNILPNAKRIGKAKALKIEDEDLKSFFTDSVVSNYYRETEKYLKNSSKRLKNENKEPLTLKVYFDAIRDKKGKVKNFTLLGGNFVVD